MLLQTPLKFWQLCKNSPAKISGTPQFFIAHVNNAGGRWNCLWSLTLRLKGRQGRCGQYQLFFFDFPLLLYPLLLIRHVVSIYSNISNAIKTTKCDKSSQIKCREDIWENMLRIIQGFFHVKNNHQ